MAVILQISKTFFASASIELKNFTFQIFATLKGTFSVPTGAPKGLVESALLLEHLRRAMRYFFEKIQMANL